MRPGDFYFQKEVLLIFFVFNIRMKRRSGQTESVDESFVEEGRPTVVSTQESGVPRVPTSGSESVSTGPVGTSWRASSTVVRVFRRTICSWR